MRVCAGQGSQRPCAVSLPRCASPPRQSWCLPAGAARIGGASCAGLTSGHAQGGSMKLGAHAWPCHPQHSCRGSAWTRRPLQKLMALSGSCRLGLPSRCPDCQGCAGHVHSRLTTRWWRRCRWVKYTEHIVLQALAQRCGISAFLPPHPNTRLTMRSQVLPC